MYAGCEFRLGLEARTGLLVAAAKEGTCRGSGAHASVASTSSAPPNVVTPSVVPSGICASTTSIRSGGSVGTRGLYVRRVRAFRLDVAPRPIFDVVQGMGNAFTRCSRQLAAVGSVALAAVVVAGTSSGGGEQLRLVTPLRSPAPEIAGKVTIAVSLKISQQGTFSVRGAVSASGLARGHQTVAGNRARMTLKLDGKAGRITLLVTQVCGKVTSTWTVVSGSGDYKGIYGGGKGKGRLTCSRKAPHRGTYAGSLRTPPPTAVAQPGVYRGTGFSPNLGVALEVLADGRTVTNLSFRGIVARCQPPGVEFLAPELSGRYPLADNGRFSIAAEGYTVAGKLSGASAKGSIAFEAGGCKAASLNWKASTPVTDLPGVSPGRYCGFTLAGSGVCLDASQDAWVTRVRFEVNLRCVEPEVATFKFEYIHGGAFGIRPDLTFAGSLSDIPLAGGGSMRLSVSGKFDGADKVTGKGGFSKVFFVHDGTRYKCRSAVAAFSAKRGA